MSNAAHPTPIEVARAIADEHELLSLVLDVLEDRCASYSLDDAADREATALAIVARLMSRGVHR
jgi:hypothetical protein